MAAQTEKLLKTERGIALWTIWKSLRPRGRSRRLPSRRAMRPQRGKEPVKNRAASAKKVFCVFLAVWLAVIAFLAAAGNGELLAALVFILGVPFMGFIGVICSVAAMPPIVMIQITVIIERAAKEAAPRSAFGFR